MPISQKTVLVLYGLLLQLAELSESSTIRATQGDLLQGAEESAWDVLGALQRLNREVQRAQVEAIQVIIAADPSIEVNPITGKIE